MRLTDTLFAELVQEEFDLLPEQLRELAPMIVLEDICPPHIAEHYNDRAATQNIRGLWVKHLQTIFLYQHAILAGPGMPRMTTEVTDENLIPLREQISKTLRHEIAHALGLGHQATEELGLGGGRR